MLVMSSATLFHLVRGEVTSAHHDGDAKQAGMIRCSIACRTNTRQPTYSYVRSSPRPRRSRRRSLLDAAVVQIRALSTGSETSILEYGNIGGAPSGVRCRAWCSARPYVGVAHLE